MQERVVIGLTESLAALDAMVKAATNKSGRPVAMVVVDHRGDMVSFASMPGVNPALARQNALKKAYTSACMRVDTAAFEDRTRSEGRTVADYGNPNLTDGRGGLVIIKPDDGIILGGIGVSGRTGEEDEEIAKAGLTALKL